MFYPVIYAVTVGNIDINIMAGGTDRLGLSERKLFQVLREHLPSLNPKTRNIIECKEDILFVWNSKDTCILTVNMKIPEDDHVDIPTHQVRKNRIKINMRCLSGHVLKL